MNNKLSLQDLASAFAERYGLEQKEAITFVKTVFEIVEEYVATDKLVKIKGLGTFKLISVSDRESVNVNTGERIVIAGHTKLTFTPDNTLKDTVNHPFSDFETTPLNESTPIEQMECIPTDTNDSQIPKHEDSDTEPILEVIETTVLDEVVPLKISETDILPQNTTLHTEITQGEQLNRNEGEEPNKPKEEQQNNSREEETNRTNEQRPVATEKEYPVANKEVGRTENLSYPMAEEDVVATTPSDQNNFKRWGYSIVTIFLMIFSYICGHYHLLGEFELKLHPDNQSTESSKITTTERTITKEHANFDNQAMVLPDSVLSESAISDATKVDSVGIDKDSVFQNANTKYKEDSIQNESPEEIAKYFPQVPNGEYLIVGDAGRVHYMQVGETLYRIAKKELGDRNLIQYLIIFNNFEDPNIIHTGDPIRIPKLVKKSATKQ